MARLLDFQRSAIPLPPLSIGWNLVPIGNVNQKAARWIRFILYCAAGGPIRFWIESVCSRSGRVSYMYPLDVFSIGEPPFSPSTDVDLFGTDFRLYIQRGTNVLNDWGPGSLATVSVWVVCEEIEVPSRRLVCHTMASQIMVAGDLPLPSGMAGGDPYSVVGPIPQSERIGVDWYPPGGAPGAGSVKLFGKPNTLGGAPAPVLLTPDYPVAFDNVEAKRFSWTVPPGTYFGQAGQPGIMFSTSGIAPAMVGGAFYFREYYRTA